MLAARSRRELLTRAGLLSVATILGLHEQAFAVTAGRALFEATSLDEALTALGARPVPSDLVSVRVPSVVEDGAVVPVTVSSAIPNVDAIFLLVEHNPLPLALAASIPVGTEAFVSTRLKLAGTGRVHGVVRAEGALYTTSMETRVARGGCH
jgi:sulfur-oxidizing protein SoxY